MGLSLGQPNPVQLEWDANPPEDEVAGYNMYRSSQSGFGYVRLNSVLISGTTYSDDTVEAGQTYYYVCTAVNTAELESGFSNEVPHTVPSATICPGEVNGDGTRNVLDVILIMNHIVGNVTLEGDDLLAADVNEDGSVNVLDTVLLQNHVVGNVTLAPCN
jgi:fibronectin type 3 domain-containing protein